MNQPVIDLSQLLVSGAEDQVSTRVFVQLLMQGAIVIANEQLSTGEIPSYRRAANGSFEYCRSPLVSAFVHDALGLFDRLASGVDWQVLDMMSPYLAQWFPGFITVLRKRIRGFIAWQEEVDGTWRFFGRGSGIDPDACTSACAATALLEQPIIASPKKQQKHLDALLRFRSSEGIYFSYINKDHLGYGWMDEKGGPVIGYDRIVNAAVLRYLGLVGGDIHDLITYLEYQVNEKDFQIGSRNCPNPLCFFYVLARTWCQAQLPGLRKIATVITPHILALQRESGDFGGPLSTAMALSALLDLEYTDVKNDPNTEIKEALEKAKLFLLRTVRPWGGWEYEDFIVNGYGAPAWSTALSLVVLARCILWD